MTATVVTTRVCDERRDLGRAAQCVLKLSPFETYYSELSILQLFLLNAPHVLSQIQRASGLPPTRCGSRWAGASPSSEAWTESDNLGDKT